MKRCGLLFKVAMLLCVAITIVSAPPSSLAYITANSNTVHNSFRVVYLPPQDISVPIRIQKTMVNLSEDDVGPGGFEFHLVNPDTGVTTVATSAADGWATMQLTFTANDVGKTYRYRLYELNAGRENVTYDETVYDISIQLLLNEDHEMYAVLTMNGTPVTEIVAQYENQYDVAVVPPDTGDHNHPLLWLVMLILSGTGLIVMGKKRTVFWRT